MRNSKSARKTEIVSKARDLVRAAGVSEPPVDVERLARMQGVREIRLESPNGADAELIPVEGGYVIRVNPDVGQARRRFSIAHEIAHSFFGHNHESYRGQVVAMSNGASRNLAYRDEERLCDRAAAEMLMPADLFMRESDGRRPSIRLFTELASRFQASVQTTVVRYTRLLAVAAQITIWKRRGGVLQGNWNRGSEIVDSAARVIRLGDPESRIQKLIHDSYESGSHINQWELEGSQRVLVDAKTFGRGEYQYVLSVLQSASFA